MGGAACGFGTSNVPPPRLAAFGVRDPAEAGQGLSYVHRVVMLQVISVEYRKAKGNHAGIIRFLLVCTGKWDTKRGGEVNVS